MRLAFLLHSLGLLAFFVSPSVSTSARLFSSWTEIRASGPSPGYRTGHIGVPDHGSDAALFFAGHDGEYKAFGDVWRFSFHGKFWEKLSVRASSSAPPARYDHCGATCSSKSGSRALFFGGASANSSLLNDVWALNLNANSSWVQLNPSSHSSPSPRRNSACVCLGVSYFLVFGGRDIRGAVSDLWIMNLDSNAWNLLTSSSALAPGPLFASCMHTLSSTKAFVFGGIDSKNVASSGAWVLDVAANNSSAPQVQPSSAQWEQLNLKPNLQARGFHSCIGPPASITDQSADVIYIRGGIGSGESRNDNILDDFQSCRVIAKGLISELHCRPALFTSALPLCSECISVMVSNIVLVHGGLGRGAEISGKTALLYLSDMRVENVFNPGEPAPVARSGAVIEHFTHVEDNEYIFLHGGIDSQDALLSDTWLFKVSTANFRWSRVLNTSQSPPARSHGCSAVLNNLIIVYGGRCRCTEPWMFNTVSNIWSPLTSARAQPDNEIPLPRWGHGCALMPASDQGSPFASVLVAFGGVENYSNSLLDDFWMLDLDFVVALRDHSLNAANSTSSPQLVALDSGLKQFLTFKLAPTHDRLNWPARGEFNWIDSEDPIYAEKFMALFSKLYEFHLGQNSPFIGENAESGFKHDFAIATWIRIIPPAGKPVTHLLFELQAPSNFNFDPLVQSTMLRLYLNRGSLEFVDFHWKVTDNTCMTSAFRVTQSNFTVSVMDGLWHHVAVAISTDLQKTPKEPHDPDILYLFGSEDCTGPNVTTLLGADFCDRSDVQKMLNESNSDKVKCIYNPGLPKRIRFSTICHSSLPSPHADWHKRHFLIGAQEYGKGLHEHYLRTGYFSPNPDSLPDFEHGAFWTIGQEATFRVPVLKDRDTDAVIHNFTMNSVLFCRNLKKIMMFDTGQTHFACIDNPLRSATRTARIFLDGIQVASGSHVDDTNQTAFIPNCEYNTNMRIAYPFIASYMHIGMFPHFDDALDSKFVGSIIKNRLSMQIGPTSIFVDERGASSAQKSMWLPFPRSGINDQSLRYHFDFSNASVQSSLFHSCFMDHARQHGLERLSKVPRFSVCAFFGPNLKQRGFITSSPFLITDATLQNFVSNAGLKSRGWSRKSVFTDLPKPPAGINVMVRIPNGALLYSQCTVTFCRDSLWFFSLSFMNGFWTQLNVVLSDSSRSMSLTEVPSFVGSTFQFQNGRLHIIGGNMRSASNSPHAGRLTVATIDVDEISSQATMNLFVYDDFSSVVDASSTSNGTHAFVFGGSIGWGRREGTILVLSYLLMSVQQILVSPISPPAALFSAVVAITRKVVESDDYLTSMFSGNVTETMGEAASRLKKGSLIVYGGSESVQKDSLRLAFAVSSSFYIFDPEISYWMRYQPLVYTNNVNVNVFTDDSSWSIARPEQRRVALPPLTEHAIVSTTTLDRGISYIIIIGGFGAYLQDGFTPNTITYNPNILFSMDNGAEWFVRGPQSLPLLPPCNPQFALCPVTWLPPRSAAAIFVYHRASLSDELVFVHGGRYFNGHSWAKNGAYGDIWVFHLGACLTMQNRPTQQSPDTMVEFSMDCKMTEVQTNPNKPLISRYFHQISMVPGSGDSYFVVIGGFAADGGVAEPSNSTLVVHYIKQTDILSTIRCIGCWLTFQSIHIPISAPFYSASALQSPHYSPELGVFFMFGGSARDFTRTTDNANVPPFEVNNNLMALKFDPSTGTSHLKELKVIGARPPARAGAKLFSLDNDLYFFGGILKDLRVQSTIFATSILNAHPNFTEVFGDALNGGVAGGISNLFVSAQTIMQRPALSCEASFSASFEGQSPGSPTYNIAFEESSVDEELQVAIYRSHFIPIVSGLYVVTVSTLQSSIEDGMPFVQEIEITAGPTCASTSRFTYSTSTVAGSNTKFLVQCKDEFLNDRPGGDRVQATVLRMSDQPDPDGSRQRTLDQFSFGYTDLKSGNHQLIASFTRSGFFRIESTLGARLIQDQPFSFVVDPKDALCVPAPGACNTLAIGSLDAVFAGQAKSMLIVAFDEYFNLANPSQEKFSISFFQDGVEFLDVAVSHKIKSSIAEHAIYFFSSSQGLLLRAFHNNTDIPATNFIRQNLQIDDVISVLQTSGRKSLFESRSSAKSGTSNDVNGSSIENVSSSTISHEIKVQNVFDMPDSVQGSAMAVYTVSFSLFAGFFIGIFFRYRNLHAQRKIAVASPDEPRSLEAPQQVEYGAAPCICLQTGHCHLQQTNEQCENVSKAILSLLIKSLSAQERVQLVEEIEDMDDSREE